MDVLLQIKVILLYGVILLSIYTIFLIIIGPLKFLGKIGVRILFGGICLFALNYILNMLHINFDIGVNLLTSLVTGYLGVFGVLAISLIKYFL
ncbi:pro-sigmaK processing inhibitor BofA family protein [Tepidibacter formicigenes]|jgi:inhibitor of the pro-sigma K processing machinery|uniref:Inhibitor of the pro-sigma K processing machinery n=1 Tax=Tepidibacter formicigenes DSM 15518 TaxID=1123349 RepID=A0A1M6TSX3_9FIRM|nr:pro-sigmaK processing inhibitor BofA family protein [Tepidibacter formicigenes]SHK60041.1 inhibitor of the pro-sigma K processing machinery [Tepidibacter formicigenes DSM 15518]